MKSADIRPGQVFGRLTVKKFLGVDCDSRSRFFLCLCLCGTKKAIKGGNLVSGATSSCGCFRREISQRKARALVCSGPEHPSFKHGATLGHKLTPEYLAYHGARSRCTNRKDKNYKNYGGRGIRFLFSSFPQFLKHIGPRPSPKLSLNRIDNDGHYQPGNVEWATASEQRRNQRLTHTGV